MSDRHFISKKLRDVIKTAAKPMVRIAYEININPGTLSRIVNRIETVKINDPKVLRLADYFELNPDECFEK